MDKIELLPLQSEYCEAVEEIARKTLPEHWSLESIRDVLHYDNNIFYVAYSTGDSQIVGFAGIMVIVDEAELLNIAIHPAFHRRGIGKMLLEWMIQEAVRYGEAVIVDGRFCNRAVNEQLLPLDFINELSYHREYRLGCL